MIKDIIFSSDDNYMDSLFESYELEYELFLIENNTFDAFNKIDNCIIKESYDTEIIQESIKETLTIWIGKFTEAIKNALDKFVAIMEGQKDLAYLKSIDYNVRNMQNDPGFNVTNVRDYDENAITNFNIVDFNTVFNTNKDSLTTEEKFLINNYGNYGFAQGNTNNIYEVLQTKLVKVVKDSVPVTVELIKGYYNWCRNDYIKDTTAIQNNMKKYNTSISAITNLINQLPDDYRDNSQTQGNPTVTQQNSSANYTSLYEEDTTAGQPINNQSQGFQTSNPGKMEFDDKVNYVNSVNKNGANQEAITMIKIYLNTTSKILSALFKIVKNRKADYMRILKHQFPVNKQMRDTAASTVNINRQETGVPLDNINNLNNQQNGSVT